MNLSYNPTTTLVAFVEVNLLCHSNFTLINYLLIVPTVEKA